MKKTIAIVFVAAIVVVGSIVNYNVYLFVIVPAMVALCIWLGCIIASDIRYLWRDIMGADNRYDSIRHKTGRNYGQAAIIVGGACLFLGEPQECEDLCDDLWHRGVQAEVRPLTGTETEFDIL